MHQHILLNIFLTCSKWNFYTDSSLPGIYEVFVGHKHFDIGKQPDLFPGTEAVSVT